jgi:cyclic beta-1,2-glucan synthetase
MKIGLVPAKSIRVRRKIFRTTEEPIRSEIFSLARLEAHAESLAAAQVVTLRPERGQDIAPRIRDNRRILEKSYQLLLQAVAEHYAVTPAAEWLLDNFHIVRAQLKDINDHLAPEFYDELPKLAGGPLAGFPRVYGIAWAFVAHTDSRFDAELFKHFLLAYQKSQSLTIGELWAVSITLRAVLMENLRRLAAKIVDSQLDRKDADRLADEVLGLGFHPRRPLPQIIAEIEKKEFSRSFAVQLLQRLRFQDVSVDPVLEWLYARLASNHLVADEVVSEEHNSQTAANATVRNIITSSRLMSVFDWRIFFEETSLVDEVLRKDQGYRRMDFTSRDRYRHGLEELARFSRFSELEIAQMVVQKAENARRIQVRSAEIGERAGDPGFYLIASGRRQFEKEIDFQPRWPKKIMRWMGRYSSFLFVVSILGLAAGLVAFTVGVYAESLSPIQVFILSLVALFPASEISVAITNRVVVALMGPKYLPRLNFENGIPLEMKTFVVVPTLLASVHRIGGQVEELETHYLSNPDPNLRFALLTDWMDSFDERTPQDDELLSVAAEKLKLLNDRYPLSSPSSSSSEKLFYIFHRKRVFNAQEGKWLGWERKRGKLHEFNQLLQGRRDTTHIPVGQAEVASQVAVPQDVRYVITLDADTKLPRGSAADLVGTLAHPLNRAYIDREKNRVTHGYGILQPRITPALPSTQDRTVFQRISAGPSGVDPYASAISDVYQDLFEEGTYTGKGIYDVAAFETVLKDRVPENALLSHDLFEGNFARCAFVSDVEFFEDFPSHSGVAALRSHRWTRGDWQLLPWIFTSRGRDISLIGRWKMLDNLRRSLVAPMTFLLLILAFSLPGAGVFRWLLLALASLFIPAVLLFIADIFPKRRITPLPQHLKYTLREVGLSVESSLLNLTLLPYRAWMSMDAIGRVLYRLFVSHRHMLEWTTAAQSKAAASLSHRSFWRGMRGAIALTGLSLIAIAFSNPKGLYLSLGLLLLWGLSPTIAHRLSLPPKLRPILPVQPEDIQLLTAAARRIWRFFAIFVTAEENFLPPDNFQEDPLPVVAHRSSPTNFGLYLLSVLAARDFGWIGTLEMADRLSSTLKSLLALPKHQGHFFNWYETTGARPLEPRYISSVDNGNLAGHLVAVAQGCLEKLNERVETTGFNRGILTTFVLLERAIADAKKLAGYENRSNSKTYLNEADELIMNLNECSRALDDLGQTLIVPDHLILKRVEHWQNLRSKADELLRVAQKTAGIPQGVALPLLGSELVAWARALKNDIDSSARDFNELLSWTEFANEDSQEDWTPSEDLAWRKIQKKLAQPIVLCEIPGNCEKLIAQILQFKRELKTNSKRQIPLFIDVLLESLEQSIQAAKDLIRILQESYQQCHLLCREMDFKMLYDPVRKLFSIGMRVSDNTLDASYYDLLASECRLTSFIAIAKGDVPVSHWFSLGRTLTQVKGGGVLISWSGSMFEYLMPSLVMHTPIGSLLEQTCNLVVRRQIEYATSKDVSWGISESAYNKRDLDLTYQYSNFGIPDLGLKRGLGGDLVIAPYASFLAAMFDSASAASNLRKLESEGAYGPYGFYESIDFTPSRLPQGKTSAVIKAYMAHHQGMSLVAMANIFKNGSMQRRFHAEPFVQATELLLQERTPRNVGTVRPNTESFEIAVVREVSEHVARVYHNADRPIPTTQLLSNGNYTVMVTSAGSGFSRFRDKALTRFREDVTRDNWGSYFFLKDVQSGKVWSATHQPTCVEPESYEVGFTEDRATFLREDDGLQSQLEIFVSPEDNAEIRRITLTNLGDSTREIEVTSYCEVILNTQAADVAHPAFSNLFVQTEFVPHLNALFATRRPRASDEPTFWMAHVLLRDHHAVGKTEYETDRELFIGRGRSVRNPQAVFESGNLSGTTGTVLDPVFSLKTKLRIESGVSVNLTFSTLVAATREELVLNSEKFADTATFERVTNLAWTQAQVKLHYLNIEPVEAHQFQRLATRLLYSDSSLRPSSDILKRNKKDVTGLWAMGISGDFPIVLLRIDDIEDRGIVRQLLKAQEYLATKRFEVDLVILNEKANSYSQELQNTLESMVHSSMGAGHSPLPQSRGKVFILRSDLLARADLDLLVTEARATLSSRLGNLAEQVKRMRHIDPDTTIARFENRPPTRDKNQVLAIPKLEFFNGVGGFSKDGREYLIVLQGQETTPAPWINVIANSGFGFQVSESGSGYTWSSNSRENQLTPWSNDPISDPSGEAFYILDQETGELWSPTASPIRVPGSVYLAAHGQGYSRFENLSHGIHSELSQFVASDEPVKISRLIIENKSSRPRKLSIAAYAEWVLGFSRAMMAPSTVTEFDEETSSIFATNPRNTEYGTQISFFTVYQDHVPFAGSMTGDRTEFIGRNSSLSEPRGLFQASGLSGRVGAGLDPCAAMQTEINLAPGASTEINVVIGQVKTRVEARDLIRRVRAQKSADILQAVVRGWDQILNKVQVETSDRALDFMLNRWWLYQTLVCRLWARSAFYQAGGAFGFRDQLQDVMALTLARPDLAREQILRAASRQFIEGDVQHWWHPPLGRGVRTHFSDDLLWLPYVASHYINVTGDNAILQEQATFLEGPLLRPDQEDSYYTPAVSHQSATIYEHCARALDRSLQTGVHGLPLMGSGDWNDGMNRVGREGKGESVWLAWFLYANLTQFAHVADKFNDPQRASAWRKHAEDLKLATDQQAWDGEWYRRAYYDDGSPLGSKENSECKIDSLAQTWAVISGAGTPERALQAMQSLEKILIRPLDEIVLLFTPPFDKTSKDPGYIKGYLPGVRENGGQYTHAAAWCVIAFAMMGNRERAHELLTLLNPVHHSLTAESMRKYKIEPYVLAGDVYSQAPHTGRGGWSWYTGSAGWMYRAALEYALGFKVHAGVLSLDPCLTVENDRFQIRYQNGGSLYTIRVQGKVDIEKAETLLDGKKIDDPLRIPLIDDGSPHSIEAIFRIEKNSSRKSVNVEL